MPTDQSGLSLAGRVLVVDDEPHIADLLATALRYEGFEPVIRDGGAAALAAAIELRPDVILLDVMLPDFDGFEVARRLRLQGERMPIIFLTARDAPADAVHGLTVGGDDYVRKPFSLEEVVARVRSVLRRARPGVDPGPLRFADLELDDTSHRVVRGEREVALSPTEYKLLRYLLSNRGRVLSRNQILDYVWDYDFDGESTVVETFVSSLRRKLDDGGPALIHTVRGVGYRLGTP